MWPFTWFLIHTFEQIYKKWFICSCKLNRWLDRVTEFPLFMFSVCLATFSCNSIFFKYDQAMAVRKIQKHISCHYESVLYWEVVVIKLSVSFFPFQSWYAKLFKVLNCFLNNLSFSRKCPPPLLFRGHG